MTYDRYLPDRLNAKGVRWAYDQCPGTSTTDLMRAPYAPARGLVRTPDRMTDGRKTVRHGYISSPSPIGAAYPAARAAAAMGLVPLHHDHDGEPRPFGTVVYVAGPTAVARRRHNAEVNAIRLSADGNKPVVLTPDQLAKVLRQTAGTIRMGDMD